MSRLLSQEQRETYALNIISQANLMLIENDYASITIMQLANNCNIAKGTIFNYFNSKEELFACVMDREMARFITMFSELFNKAKYTFEDLKRNFIKALQLLVEEHGNLLKLLTLEKDIIAPKLTESFSNKRAKNYESMFKSLSTMLKTKISILDDDNALQLLNSFFIIARGVQTADISKGEQLFNVTKSILACYLDGFEKNVWESQY